jgi:hypothetical protein
MPHVPAQELRTSLRTRNHTFAVRTATMAAVPGWAGGRTSTPFLWAAPQRDGPPPPSGCAGEPAGMQTRSRSPAHAHSMHSKSESRVHPCGGRLGVGEGWPKEGAGSQHAYLAREERVRAPVAAGLSAAVALAQVVGAIGRVRSRRRAGRRRAWRRSREVAVADDRNAAHESARASVPCQRRAGTRCVHVCDDVRVPVVKLIGLRMAVWLVVHTCPMARHDTVPSVMWARGHAHAMLRFSRAPCS